MELYEVEQWMREVRRICLEGKKVEDARVELKGAAIDPYKSARQLAAIANAVRDRHVLWINGLHENGEIGEAPELADWWHQVRSHFQAEPPRLACDVRSDGMHGLLFETDRRPFVVKIPAEKGRASLEVPWREGETTRSARHEDLIDLLVPQVMLPEVDPRFCTLRSDPSRAGLTQLFVNLDLGLYIVPLREGRVVIPFYRCELLVRLPGDLELNAAPLRISARNETPENSPHISVTPREIICSGPGYVLVKGAGEMPIGAAGLKQLEILCRLQPVPGSGSIVLNLLVNRTDKSALVWSLGDAPERPRVIRLYRREDEEE